MICTRCPGEKISSDFYPSVLKSKRLICKGCHKQIINLSRSRHPESLREVNKRAALKLSPEEVQRRWKVLHDKHRMDKVLLTDCYIRSLLHKRAELMNIDIKELPYWIIENKRYDITSKRLSKL